MSLEYKILGQDATAADVLVADFAAISFFSSTAAHSTDAITWTQATLPATDTWYSVAYGDDKFVTVAYNSTRAAYSTDGITWTASTLPATDNWQSVTYGDDKFVTVSYSTAIYSTDGITWTASTLPASASWRSVTYGDGKFVTVAYNSTRAAYSTDGITWTQTTLPASDFWTSVTYEGGKFVTVAYDSSTAAYSTDAITWTQATLPATDNWYSVTSGTRIGELAKKSQYTVPSTKQAIISSIFIANNTESSQTYSVAVVPDGETLSSIHYIRKDVTLDANDFNTIETKVTLSEGDQIITESSSKDVTINIFGVEK